MIIKTFELGRKDLLLSNLFLFYGENEGFKNQIIKNNFLERYKNNIHRYEEKEILENKNNFFNEIFSKSFFEKEKLIIISRVTDKIKDTIEEIIEKKIIDIKIILLARSLEKKSKIRNFFEKEKMLCCIPFYSDNSLTLGKIIDDFFRKKKISISSQMMNLIANRCRGDRQNLDNELSKIENFIGKKKSISTEEIIQLTNLAENYDVSELADNILTKNQKQIINILSENNYSSEDCVFIIRTLLAKSKRLLKLKKESSINQNLDQIISSFKPPIFWKDKDIVKKQINCWSQNCIENLIYKINEIEFLIKTNSNTSINILSNFIMEQSSTSSNN